MQASTIIRSPGDFGNLIRRHRRGQALTQAQLAARAGLDVKQVSRIETATNEPRLSTMLALCAALGIVLQAENDGAAPALAPDIADLF